MASEVHSERISQKDSIWEELTLGLDLSCSQGKNVIKRMANTKEALRPLLDQFKTDTPIYIPKVIGSQKDKLNRLLLQCHNHLTLKLSQNIYYKNFMVLKQL